MNRIVEYKVTKIIDYLIIIVLKQYKGVMWTRKNNTIR